MVGGVVLAHLLLPRDYGFFAIVSLFLFAANATGDLGLAVSVIQQRNEPTSRQLRVIFTTELGLGVIAALAVVGFTPVAVGLAHLPADIVGLVRFTALYLVIIPFRVMPTVLLERHLLFSRIVVADLVAAVCYQGSAILGAWFGLGAWALSLGLVSFAAGGAVAINLISRWPIGLAWDWTVIRGRLRFSALSQAASTLTGLEGASVPVVVGMVSGAAAVGYVTFAMTAVNAAMVIPNAILQVALPSMSRAQSDRLRLGRGLAMALKATLYTLGAAYLPFLISGREVVELVFSSRWLPATHLIPLLAVAGILRCIALIVLTTLLALGQSGISFVVNAILTVGGWVLTVVLVRQNGYIGAAESWLALSVPLPALLLLARRQIPFDIWSSTVQPVLPLLLVLALFGLLSPHPVAGPLPLRLFEELGAAWAVYLTAVGFIERRNLVPAWRLLRHSRAPD